MLRTEGDASEYEDLCLVKVYDNINSPGLFSFWVPVTTGANISTVVCLYWKFLLQKDPSVRIKSKTVWVALKDLGEGKYSGHATKYSDPLSLFFAPEYAEGTLEKEDVFGNRDESAGINQSTLVQGLDDNIQGQGGLVLRLYVGDKPASKNSRVCYSHSLL
jgi:hypothetical protein